MEKMLMSTQNPPRIADDNDFNNLKKLIDDHKDWILELNKANTQVWTRTVHGCEFNMVKILSSFDDCSADVVFDVLNDPDYRKVWDTHMLASEEIGIINVNNDVGYYAMACPAPLQPRDFVLMRSWLDTGPNGEQMLLSRSVPHKNYPPRKGYVRAQSHLTGFIARSLPHGGCFLGYVAHCDPQGHLPPWLVNKVTHTLGPKMVKELRKASLGYIKWKSSQQTDKKPWRYPEDITIPRILLEEDCVEPNAEKRKIHKKSHSISQPSTPVTNGLENQIQPNLISQNDISPIPSVTSRRTLPVIAKHMNIKISTDELQTFNIKETSTKKKKKVFGKN